MKKANLMLILLVALATNGCMTICLNCLSICGPALAGLCGTASTAGLLASTDADQSQATLLHLSVADDGPVCRQNPKGSQAY